MLKTAESVTPRHPDKCCDRISDAILDACLEQDPDSRVAVETMGGHGIISVTGEITTKAYVDIRKVVESVVGGSYGVTINVVSQSPEIKQGVDTGGAGDQGIMVGYACRDNEDMIPQELYLARKLCKHLYNKFPEDGKTQITIDENNIIQTIVASFANTDTGELHHAVLRWLEDTKIDDDVIIYANPAGDWSVSGFEADTGLTGRKLAVDNYGPQIPIGGGAFSGKDASKVDRSGAYMARKIAVDYLKEYHEVSEVYVKLAYSIGVAEPVMVSISVKHLTETDIDQYNHLETDVVNNIIKDFKYDLTPKGIIDFLELKKPQFQKTAEWGHMGNGFKWDK